MDDALESVLCSMPPDSINENKDFYLQGVAGQDWVVSLLVLLCSFNVLICQF